MFLIIILLILGFAGLLFGSAAIVFGKNSDSPILGFFLASFGGIIVMMVSLFLNTYNGGV